MFIEKIKKKILIVTLLILLIPFSSYGINQTWSLKSGFNFYSLVISTGSTYNSRTILTNNSSIKSIFFFDSATQSFKYQMKLDSGDIFGDDITFKSGEGYIIECKDTTSLSFEGSIFSDGGSHELKTNFNLTGFPELTTSLTAYSLFENNSSIKSIFKWNDTDQNFEYVMKLSNGTIFGPDFPLQSGIAYFLNATSDFTVTFGTVKNDDYVPGPNDVLSGINHMTPVDGKFTAIVNNFLSTEELIVITYTSNTNDSNFSYTFSGVENSSSPQILNSPTPVEYFINNSGNPVESRMRYLENLTAESMKKTGGPVLRAPSHALASPSVGEQRNFYCLSTLNWPPGPDDWVEVTATCKSVGTHCYLFEDNSVNSPYSKYPDEAWAIFRDIFDNTIYPTDTSTFGSEPNPGIDNDSRVYILFSPNINKQNASGYFDSTNELTTDQVKYISGGGTYFTNEKEMFFMQMPSDSYPWGDSLKNHVLSILSHEFLHMIVYNQHVMVGGAVNNEENWLNEGLAQVAQDECGYGYQNGNLSYTIKPFLDSPGDYSLTNFTFNLGQYGISYLFTRFIVDQGVDKKAIVSTTKTGVANVEAVTGKKFSELMKNWTTALWVSDNSEITSDSIYHYTNLKLRSTQADGTIFTGPALAATKPSFPVAANSFLRGSGVKFVRITGGTGKTVTLTCEDTGNGDLGLTIIRKGK